MEFVPTGRVLAVSVWSPALGRGVPAQVYLPPAALASARYPVLYLLHGVPGDAVSMFHGLGLASTLDRLIDGRQIPPLVVVAPSDGPTTATDTEWEDSVTDPTASWATFVADDLVAWADRNLPVCTTRDGRAVAGISMGAFGAVNLALRHPDEFGAVMSWSGYFVANTPDVDGPAGSPDAAQDSPLRYLPSVASSVRAEGLRIAFYSSGSDPFNGENVAFAAALSAAGIPYQFETVPGGHMMAVWRSQLAPQLRWLGSALTC